MSENSSTQFYVNWAKARIEEIEATLKSLESKVGELGADVRLKAKEVLADLRVKRDAFAGIVKQHQNASETAWKDVQVQLEKDWAAFETAVDKYGAVYGGQVEQQAATLQARAAAQVKSWREAAENFRGAAVGLAAKGHNEIDAAVKRMQAEAAAAETKFTKMKLAGTESWSAFGKALTESRQAFDRANQAVHDAFKRV